MTIERRLSYSEARMYGANPIRAVLGYWRESEPADQKTVKTSTGLRFYYVENGHEVTVKDLGPQHDTMLRQTPTTKYTHDQINKHCPGFRFTPDNPKEKTKGEITNTLEIHRPKRPYDI